MHNTSWWPGGEVVTPRPRGPGHAAPSVTDIFDIDLERRADQPVVAHVIGALDLLTTPVLRRCLDDHVGSGGLVLDLSRVDFLAASGLTVLTDTDDRALRDRLAWALVANSRPVLRPLEVLGLREALPTFDTVPDAVAAVRAASVNH